MSSTWITVSPAPRDGSVASVRETEIGSCALMAVWLFSALAAGTAHARSVAGRAALGQAGDQLVTGFQLAVQRLHQLGKGVVGDPGLDPDRLQGFVGMLFPHHLRLVAWALAFAAGCRWRRPVSRWASRRGPARRLRCAGF